MQNNCFRVYVFFHALKTPRTLVFFHLRFHLRLCCRFMAVFVHDTHVPLRLCLFLLRALVYCHTSEATTWIDRGLHKGALSRRPCIFRAHEVEAIETPIFCGSWLPFCVLDERITKSARFPSKNVLSKVLHPNEMVSMNFLCEKNIARLPHAAVCRSGHICFHMITR